MDELNVAFQAVLLSGHTSRAGRLPSRLWSFGSGGQFGSVGCAQAEWCRCLQEREKKVGKGVVRLRDLTSSLFSSLHHNSSSAPRERSSPPQDPSPPVRTVPHGSDLPPAGSNVKLLHLDGEHGTQATTGYVKSSRGTLQPAKAVIYRTLDGNVVSVSEVVRLGLVSQSLGGVSSGAVHLKCGLSSYETSVGKVTLQWSKDSSNNSRHPPLTLECEVSELSRTGLIFWPPLSRCSQVVDGVKPGSTF